MSGDYAKHANGCQNDVRWDEYHVSYLLEMYLVQDELYSEV